MKKPIYKPKHSIVYPSLQVILENLCDTTSFHKIKLNNFQSLWASPSIKESYFYKYATISSQLLETFVNRDPISKSKPNPLKQLQLKVRFNTSTIFSQIHFIIQPIIIFKIDKMTMLDASFRLNGTYIWGG
jgi:hypothetical protein